MHDNNDEVEEEPVQVFTQEFVKNDKGCNEIENSDITSKYDDQGNDSIIVSEIKSEEEPKNMCENSSESEKSFVEKTPTESDNIECEVEKF